MQMENRKHSKSRILADYGERKAALLLAGYTVRHETVLPSGVFCRLHHMANGNDITLCVHDDTLIQKTNHITTFSQTYETD